MATGGRVGQALRSSSEFVDAADILHASSEGFLRTCTRVGVPADLINYGLEKMCGAMLERAPSHAVRAGLELG